MLTPPFFHTELKDQNKDWVKNKYYETVDTLLPQAVDTLPRVDYRDLSEEEFRNKYELPRIPIVITHAMDEWAAMKKWTVKVICHNRPNQ